MHNLRHCYVSLVLLGMGITACGAAEDAAFTLNSEGLTSASGTRNGSEQFRRGGGAVDGFRNNGPDGDLSEVSIGSGEDLQEVALSSLGSGGSEPEAQSNAVQLENPGLHSPSGQREQSADLQVVRGPQSVKLYASPSSTRGSGQNTPDGPSSPAQCGEAGHEGHDSVVGLSRRELWPPNHKMVPVTVTVAKSSATECRVVSISDNETNDGRDAEITGPLSVNLRATRDGRNEAGRTYSLKVECETAQGEIHEEHLEVLVPHDQGR